MEILDERTFKTRNNVTIRGNKATDGMVYLRFDGLYRSWAYGRHDYPVALYPEEHEALVTLMDGGTLEVKPKFKEGDLVRYVQGRVSRSDEPMASDNDALAKVIRLGDEWLYVEWLCTRSRGQMNGGYHPDSFDVITKDDLSRDDKVAIADRALRQFDTDD